MSEINKKDSDLMEKIVSLCKRRGFIYQGSEIYGGLAGTWDYGPLGVALKNNIKNSWRKKFIDSRDDMYEVDAALLMNPKVWETSGHVGGFADPMVECGNCKKRFRTDQLLLQKSNERDYQSYLTLQEQGLLKNLDNTKIILETESVEKNISQISLARKYLGIIPQWELNKTGDCSFNASCPSCGKQDWGISRSFNMMFKTQVGSMEDSAATVYFRPETAQGMFVNFKNILDSFSPKLPFGMAQIGKAFRNEITPKDFVFRVREFEQMEIEYFIKPPKNDLEWQEQFELLRVAMLEWMKEIGIDTTKVHELKVEGDDLAHYSKATTDFEFDFPFGKKELYGLAYRTDFDLSAHQKASGVSLEYFDQDGETQEDKKFIPHVIEPSFGVERTVLAVLSSAYREDEQSGEIRSYLAFKPNIAPIICAVSPLLKNRPELQEKAREVYKALKQEFGRVMFDDNGNVGKRYRRQDEIGTPFCIVVDFDTIGTGDNINPEFKDMVTVRDRDTGTQERVAIDQLENYIAARI